MFIGNGGTSRQFDSMTPREVQWRLETLVKQEEREWQRTAQLAAWVLQSLGAKVTANKLLGKPAGIVTD